LLKYQHALGRSAHGSSFMFLAVIWIHMS
jgi:hypothetical protein